MLRTPESFEGELDVVIASARGKTRRTRRTRVRASSTGLEVGGETIAAAAIRAAYYQPRGDLRATVRAIGVRGTPIFEAEVASREQAAALLRSLGHDVAHRRLRFGEVPTVAGTLLTAVLAFLAAGVGIASLATQPGADPLLALLGFAMVIPVLAAVASLRRSRMAEVGADGVVVTARRRRFVPYSAVREARVRPVGARTAVEVELRSGERLRVGSLGIGPEHLLQQLALLARIEEGLAAYRRSSPPPDLVGVVGRAGRTLADWRADLSRLGEDGEGYRAPATEARQEHLFSIVEDPSAPEDARAAAARALRSGEAGKSADVLARLRVAGDAIASPRLRVAVETAADPRAAEPALDDALAPFVDEDEEDEGKRRLA